MPEAAPPALFRDEAAEMGGTLIRSEDVCDGVEGTGVYTLDGVCEGEV